MIEDLDADALYARRFETFTNEDEKNWMKLSEDGTQIKVMRAK